MGVAPMAGCRAVLGGTGLSCQDISGVGPDSFKCRQAACVTVGYRLGWSPSKGKAFDWCRQIAGGTFALI